MTQVLILSEGTLRYTARVDLHTWETEAKTCRVFIVDWKPNGGNVRYATVVLREPATFQNEPPAPAGAIREVTAWDEYGGDYLTVDIAEAVPA